jgi:hypothetical protein
MGVTGNGHSFRAPSSIIGACTLQSSVSWGPFTHAIHPLIPEFTGEKYTGFIETPIDSGSGAYCSEVDDGKLPPTCKQKRNKANYQVEHGFIAGTRGIEPTIAEK